MLDKTINQLNRQGHAVDTVWMNPEDLSQSKATKGNDGLFYRLTVKVVEDKNLSQGQVKYQTVLGLRGINK